MGFGRSDTGSWPYRFDQVGMHSHLRHIELLSKPAWVSYIDHSDSGGG